MGSKSVKYARSKVVRAASQLRSPQNRGGDALPAVVARAAAELPAIDAAEMLQ